MLEADSEGQQTVVAVAIAKLSEPALVARQRGHGSFAGTGKALSVAAGRLSYVHGLKACPITDTSSQEPANRLCTFQLRACSAERLPLLIVAHMLEIDTLDGCALPQLY